MWLLYIDESGDQHSTDGVFVLGGVAVRDYAVRSLDQDLTGVLSRHMPEDVTAEFHAGPIRSGKGRWRRVPRQRREALVADAAAAVGHAARPFRSARPVVLFSVAWSSPGLRDVDPIERCFEEMFLRFQSLLIRCGPDERGLVIADESRHEPRIQPLVNDWRVSGTRYAQLTRIVEVPLFVDSAASRPIQAADLVAHAVYRSYAHGDEVLLAPLMDGFDRDDARLHGLVHLTRAHHTCACAACANRRASGR